MLQRFNFATGWPIVPVQRFRLLTAIFDELDGMSYSVQYDSCSRS
jgi:hypothetical protein